MPSKEIGIIVNGATGRICSTQHLKNALVPLRHEGGLAVGDDRIVPRLLLVGRDAGRLAEVAKAHAAGRHIYTEKPVAPSVAEGMGLLRAAQARGLKHGAVEDKVYLPGL